MSTVSAEDRGKAAMNEIHRLLVIAAMERDDPDQYPQAIAKVYAFIDLLDDDTKDELVASLLWPDACEEADWLEAKAKDHIETAFGAPLPRRTGQR